MHLRPSLSSVALTFSSIVTLIGSASGGAHDLLFIALGRVLTVALEWPDKIHIQMLLIGYLFILFGSLLLKTFRLA